MKKLSLAITIIIFLLICCDGIKAQTTQSTLNQIELMKQFVGTWKFELAKDTNVYWDIKSYGVGMEGNFRIATKDITLMEGKQLWGYDKNLDKWISAQMMKGVTYSFMHIGSHLETNGQQLRMRIFLIRIKYQKNGIWNLYHQMY